MIDKGQWWKFGQDIYGHIYIYIVPHLVKGTKRATSNKNLKKSLKVQSLLMIKLQREFLFLLILYINALNAKLSNWCGSTVHIINSADTLICSLRRHFCLIDPNPSSEMYYISFVLPMAVVPNLFFHGPRPIQHMVNL